MPVPEKCNNVKRYHFPCILISRFSYAENLLYFSLADFPVNLIRQIKTNISLPKFLSYYCLHFTKNIVYHIPEMLIFYADKVSAMGHYRHSRVFNFVNVLKSQKLDAHKNSRFTVKLNGVQVTTMSPLIKVRTNNNLVICSQIVNLFLVQSDPEIFADKLHEIQFILEPWTIACYPDSHQLRWMKKMMTSKHIITKKLKRLLKL